MLASKILVGTVIAALAAASTAAAQTDDPSAGSPPGVVYQLPLDKGRSDAAPRTPGSGGSERNGDDGSLYRSENNFGSSSSVPGVGPSADARGAAESVAEPADADVQALPASAGAVDAGDPSEPWSFALLGVIAVAGIGLGIAAVRARR